MTNNDKAVRYLMRGEIFAEPSGRRKTSLGPQRVWNPRHQGRTRR